MAPSAKHQRGFTLIELLCATCILVVGMLAVFTAEQTTAKSFSTSRHLFVATNLTNNMLEMANVLPTAQLKAMASANFTQNFDSDGAPMGVSQKQFYRLTLSLVSATATSTTVLVKVTWPDSAATGSTTSFQMTAQI